MDQFENLLLRKPVEIDLVQVSKFILNKSILITGAAGSIGSELVRQLAQFNPQNIILFDHDENNLFFFERELRTKYPNLNLISCLGSITNRDRVQQVFSKYTPDLVYHAAAHKHVALSEQNINQAVYNNVIGTKIIAEAAEKYQAESFVMISTDKAVNPTNILGASKRIAEQYIQCLAQSSKTKFVTVRFGNVLGSAGSVIPLFKQQIEAGGPVLVTHPEVTRFFMSIPEAARLTLQASVFGTGGEIFILEMGQPIKILDLAINLIKSYNLEPYKDILIQYTGLKPGEKLTEELFFDFEERLPTQHPKIMKTNNSIYLSNILEEVTQLEYLTQNSTDTVIRNKLKTLIPTAKL